LNTESIIRAFQLSHPKPYDGASLARVSHLKHDALRKAAVLVGFVERNNQTNILFTKRANHLKHHPGQISFPGGKFEPEDQSLFVTAIRETHEEIGISQDYIQTFGSLPELTTISGFSVTPVLAKISSDFQLNIDRNEVSTVFEVPVQYLFNRNNLKMNDFVVNNTLQRLFFFPYAQHLIWGVTAQIIDAIQRQFLNLSLK